MLLPRIYPHTYSNCSRPKRSLPIPKKYWGFFVQVFEFPKGVVIDENGIVQPLLKQSKKYPPYPFGSSHQEEEEETDEEFSPKDESESSCESSSSAEDEEDEETEDMTSSEDEEPKRKRKDKISKPCKKSKYVEDDLLVDQIPFTSEKSKEFENQEQTPSKENQEEFENQEQASSKENQEELSNQEQAPSKENQEEISNQEQGSSKENQEHVKRENDNQIAPEKQEN